METQYSVEFFTSFVEQLQDVCRNYLHFSQFVEVSGYVCVEIDNLKKERYVLSELLQSSGNVVSESYCTKSFKTNRNTSHPVGRFEGRTVNVEQNTRDSHSVFKRSKQNFHSPYNIPQMAQRQDLVQTVCDQVESLPGPLKKHRTSCRQDTFDSHNDSWVVNQLMEERVTLPQTFNQDNSEPSTSAASSTPSNQVLPLPQDEEIIDLDLFDDDLDVAMEDEGSRNVLSSGLAFAPAHSADIIQRKHSHLSPASLATMRYTVKQFQRFLFNKCNEDIDLFSTTPENLNELLLDFFKEAKKVNGEENLRPRSLKNVQTCLDKFLRDGGYPYSVLRDQQFQSSREYLKKKMNESAACGGGSNTVSESDIESLFQIKLLGSHNPESLTNTMWFFNSKYFILKHPLEHQNLRWGDICLRMNDSGQEYLERTVNERYTLKVYSKPAKPDRCFVNFYKQYSALRPKIALDDDYSFYLRVDESDDQECWFLPEPIHPGTLACIWKKILLTGRLRGRRVGCHGDAVLCAVQFFTSFVEQLQDLCRNYLHFSQFVEVSGYVCVEIDNLKKERYVLSELLQRSGNVVSESSCTKSLKTPENTSASWNSSSQRRRERDDFKPDSNKENISEDENSDTFASSSPGGELYMSEAHSEMVRTDKWGTVPPSQKQQFRTSSKSESVSFTSRNAPSIPVLHQRYLFKMKRKSLTLT